MSATDKADPLSTLSKEIAFAWPRNEQVECVANEIDSVGSMIHLLYAFVSLLRVFRLPVESDMAVSFCLDCFSLLFFSLRILIATTLVAG